MAFKATLKIDSNEFEVMSADYSFARSIDYNGRPSSQVYGGQVNLTIQSTQDTSIIEAMVNNPFKPIKGSIVFYKGKEEASMKELTFSEAYIIAFAEGFSNTGDDNTTSSFSITAEHFKIGGAEHDAEWPKK
jgi:hypothetical protein